MEKNQIRFVTEPKVVLKTLDQLRSQLQTALNDQLISLIVYGDFVRRADFVPGQSSIEVLMVLENVSTDVLDLAVKPLAWGKNQLPLSVMTLTENDLQTSCDVFPIRFVDMQEHHRLLCGRDVLAELKIADDHLRLRCEQELKNLMIRLRRIYLRNCGDPQKLRSSMTDSIGLVVRLLSMALTLKQGFAPDEHLQILETANAEFGINTDVLKTVLKMRSTSDNNSHNNTFNSYMTCVREAADAVDKMDIATEAEGD